MGKNHKFSIKIIKKLRRFLKWMKRELQLTTEDIKMITIRRRPSLKTSGAHFFLFVYSKYNISISNGTKTK